MSDDERLLTDARRRLLHSVGATSALVGLAGCLGGDDSDDDESDTDGAGDADADGDGTDDRSGSDETDDTDDSGDDTEADLLDAFGDIFFDEGNLLVDVADDIELDEIVLRDPHGRHVDQDTPAAGEGTASFELDSETARGFPENAAYTHGTYTVLGFQDEETAEVDSEGTVVTDGLALVASDEYDIQPDPQLVGVQGSGEDSEAEFVLRNDGTGTWPVFYRGTLFPDSNPGRTEGTWNDEGYLPPGEEMAVTARTRIGREYEDEDQAREEFCNGETIERTFYLYVDIDKIREYHLTISLGGDVILDDSFAGSGGTVYCSELADEGIEQR